MNNNLKTNKTLAFVSSANHVGGFPVSPTKKYINTKTSGYGYKTKSSKGVFKKKTRDEREGSNNQVRNRKRQHQVNATSRDGVAFAAFNRTDNNRPKSVPPATTRSN